jgi:hypothetical protein
MSSSVKGFRTPASDCAGVHGGRRPKSLEGGNRGGSLRRRLFERALALNPQSVEAQSSLADALATRVLARQTDTPAADIARAEELVGRALVASTGSTRAHYVKGQVLRAQGRCQEAIPQLGALQNHWFNAG